MDLLDIQCKVGFNFIHVTHDQEEAMSMSNRIAVMVEGKVAQIGSPPEIYYRPTGRSVADFIGESNFFVGKVVESTASLAIVEVPGFEQPGRAERLGEPGSNSQEVTVIVRPERITVSSSKPEAVDNVGKGILAKASFMGMYTQLYVEVGDTLTKIFSPKQSEAANDWNSKIGQPIYLSWNPRDGNLLLQ